jgi:hypothetical protein
MARIEVAALRRNRQSWQPAVGRMAVTTQGILSTNFFAGQEVEITGVAGRPRIAAAEGTFDYRAYLSHLGIYYTLQAASEQDWRVVASPSKPPLAERFRARVRNAFRQVSRKKRSVLAIAEPDLASSLNVMIALSCSGIWCSPHQV